MTPKYAFFFLSEQEKAHHHILSADLPGGVPLIGDETA